MFPLEKHSSAEQLPRIPVVLSNLGQFNDSTNYQLDMMFNGNNFEWLNETDTIIEKKA